MGQIWMQGGGGSADLDAVTAAAGDVLAGKVIVDAEGNPVTGTMADVASIDPAKSIVCSNGNFYIRMTNGAHIHNTTSGFPEVSVSGDTLGDAAAANVLSGKTFTSKNGLKLSGSIASMAGKTIAPSSSAQTVACSGKYMTGNIVVSAIPSKYVDVSSGVTVFHNGTLNTAILPEGFKNVSTAESISYSSSGVPYESEKNTLGTAITGNTIDFSRFTKLTIGIIVKTSGDTKEVSVKIYDASSTKGKLGKALVEGYEYGWTPEFTVSIDVSSVNQHGFILAYGSGYDEEEDRTTYYGATGYITSIKLS